MEGFVFLIPQFLFYGLIVWVIVRAVRGRRGPDTEDSAVSVKRLFVYGLLFATLMLAVSGAVLTLEEMLETDTDPRGERSEAIALGLSFVIVGAPAYGLLLTHVRRRLAEQAVERESFAWAAYLNLALGISLLATVVYAFPLFESILGVGEFRPERVAQVAVWSLVWVGHWFWLKPAHGIPGDLHLAAGSLIGLITLAIGVGTLIHAAADAVYEAAADAVPVGHPEPEPRSGLVLLVLGALVWGWHWLREYLSAERTPLWHAYVVPIVALGGLVTTLVSGVMVAYWALVWTAGDVEDVAAEHFEDVPVMVAALLVGAGVWQYHRAALQRPELFERSEPLRVYDYLMAAASLVAGVVGATLAIVAGIEAITPEPVGVSTSGINRLILAILLIVVGGGLWRIFWETIQEFRTTDIEAELLSTVRRAYLMALFGIGGVVVIGSLIAILSVALEDLLDGVFGGLTVRSFRVGVALLGTVTGVAWYHLAVYRSDREELEELIPTTAAAPRRHIVLVAHPGSLLPSRLATATGADLELWHRTDDGGSPTVDLRELTEIIEAVDSANTLVLGGPDGPTVVPYEV